MLIPKILTVIFILVALGLVVLLIIAAWKHRNPPIPETDLEDLKDLGPVATNRWLYVLRVFFILMLITLLGFHSFWAFRADHQPEFIQAKKYDQRNRRLAESGLKGWVLDRTGNLENALIRYRSDNGVIVREYPLGGAAVHLTGFSDFILGSGGMEHAYRDWLTEPTSVMNQLQSPTPVGKDLKVSVDSSLQREAYNLIQSTNQPAAAVVLLLPNNEVLAMASTPTFDPHIIEDDKAWDKLTSQVEDAQPISPMVNRALGTLVTGGSAFYYRPGSTFKTFIAAVAIDLGITEEKFTCRAEGFTPPGSGREIKDYRGEVHGTIGLRDAFTHSCNQYFSQLGLKIGRERLATYAKKLHFTVSPDDNTRRAFDLWHSEHGDKDDFNYVFAPPVHKMNLSSKATDYDVALQSIGQGFTDLTVMEMAVLSATVANSDGKYIAPTFETGGQKKEITDFIKPQSAAKLRELMKLVVQSGTAQGAFSSYSGRFTAGGKTGTADRDVLVFDKATGKPVLDYKDKDGNPHYKFTGYTDSWFIGFAPADNPQIAFAVMVENGGQGAKAAAPIAAKLIEKAQSLGYVRSGQHSQAPSRKPSKTSGNQ
ncbi:MAG: penicillin-binding transpeptidase domain-containing protein [Acidobacteriota bacterium]